MAAGDFIEATVGSQARNVAVGKQIRMTVGDDGDVESSEQKLFTLLYDLKGDVKAMRVWLIALTACVAALVLWQMFGG